MIGDFGDRKPLRKDPQSAGYGSNSGKESYFITEEFAENLVKQSGMKIETHRVLIQVDVNGIYLRLHEWLTQSGVPIRDGLVLSRFAFFQIYDTFEKIKKSIIKFSFSKYEDLESVIEKIRRAEGNGIWLDPKKTFIKFSPQFDLFYAPAPHRDIARWLRKEVQSGNLNLKRLAENAGKGIIDIGNTRRNYDAYDDFIEKLKANPEYSHSNEGFFSYYVGPKGLQHFDEKEVDTHMVIRAMDALYNYEADTICVVSSDQDFLPLRKKAAEFGISFYQADLAKFNMSFNIGRKLKELGPNFIEGRIDPSWPLKIIIEASSSAEHGSQALYQIHEDELKSLCLMHNSMNNYKVSPNFDIDRRIVGLTLSKPSH